MMQSRQQPQSEPFSFVAYFVIYTTGQVEHCHLTGWLYANAMHIVQKHIKAGPHMQSAGEVAVLTRDEDEH